MLAILSSTESEDSQVALVAKNLPANAGNIRDTGSISGLGRSPGGGHGNSLQYSCLENLHGERSLAGCSPSRCKELDMTEQLSSQACTHVHKNIWFTKKKSSDRSHRVFLLLFSPNTLIFSEG